MQNTAKHNFVQIGAYQGQTPQYRQYTTQSVYIPMRDGVKLAAEVVLPKDLPAGEKIPVLLSQTRYWRAIELRAPFKWFLKPEVANPDYKDFQPFFTNRGYGLVTVDVRGTGASFGTWPYPWHRETIEDSREIVDWIVSQPWSNGKLGAYGISYLGTTAELLAVLGHPAVKAVIPMFNHPDAYRDIAFPGGIFDDRFVKAWGYFDQVLDSNTVPKEFGILGNIAVKGVKPVDEDVDGKLLKAAIREHGANGDAHQLARDITYRDELQADMGVCADDLAIHSFNDQLARSKTITCGWGSWMDAGTADAVLRRFLTYDNAQRAVIGAWEHGGRFNASPYRRPDAPPNPGLREQWHEMLRFFDAYLKDSDNGVRDEKTLFYYTMGEEQWKMTSVWPPEGTTMQRWYLAGEQSLSQDRPEVESGSDKYEVDFQASTGEYNRWWEMGAIMNKSVVYPDRAQASQRLLTYTSTPLEQNTEITGTAVVRLYVTSTETDGAFYVYLEDVDQQGQVRYVTEGQLRAIHHKVNEQDPPYKLQAPYHSFKQQDAQALIPGEMTEITFGLHPTSVLIRKGHRLRVSIAGHDQDTFMRLPTEGQPTISIARNKVHASSIDLPVVTGGATLNA